MFLATLANIVIVSLCVMVHYEMLARISSVLPTLKIIPRIKILVGVLGALIAHIMEIWIFALGYYLLIKTGKFGDLVGSAGNGLIDYAYYSFVTYTSLGFGDVLPTDHLRFLTGLETLTGLVLIAWTASFMFLEMQKYWRH
ncbi:MAG: ion channel [Gammaproteobacteria bacterium]|nr:ion channel [Gammaproteobacteria bacterium]